MSGFDLPPTRNIRKDGTVKIPDEVLEEANLEEGDQVLVGKAEDGAVVITRWDEEEIRESIDS